MQGVALADKFGELHYLPYEGFAQEGKDSSSSSHSSSDAKGEEEKKDETGAAKGA